MTVLTDLAALQAGLSQLPLPGFFNDEQLRHALQSSAADLLLTDQAERIERLQVGFRAVGEWRDLSLFKREIAPVPLPPGTAKISFTSGSTGQPKGVCLAAAGLLDTAEALVLALAELPIRRHLSALPLALLLENVAGIYAPILRGAEIVLPRLADLGWLGMGGFDPAQLGQIVEARQPDSLILVPELLKAWTLMLQTGPTRAPASLKFVAVGGTRCDPALIKAARAVGLPAYEGYGMTECGSVVSLNRPGTEQIGSVGQVLRHVQLELDAEHEIQLQSRAFLGYLAACQSGKMDSQPTIPKPFATGDLGHLDANGFLRLDSRRKHLIITVYARNIAPEWVEAALLAQPEILQAVIFGEARPWLAALLVTVLGLDVSSVAEAVARANAGLPDYAQVRDWLTCAAFTPANGLATGNGRPIRSAILQAYAPALDTLYSAKESRHVVL